MNLKLYIQNSADGKIYNASDIVGEVTISESINGDAGKLTCILEKDPNNLLQLSNGSSISFIVDGTGFFFGYIFKIGTDLSENYKITAYNQMRYLKNQDIYVTKNMTASDIFAKICKDKNLRYNIKVPTKYIPPAYIHDKKSLYQIIERGKNLASLSDKKMYYITDRFGVLTWSELSAEKTNIQLGDNSLVTSFTYEKSIDNNTYNQIKLYRDNENTGKRDIWIVKDSNNIKKWGLLQYLAKPDSNLNSSQIKELAQNYLKKYNAETKTLRLQCDGILELVAGRGIKFKLERENIDEWLWIKSSTHYFTKNSHTMDLEVAI